MLCALQVDARGSTNRLAAFLVIDDEMLFTDGVPTNELMARFRQRNDNQITSTEMLSISLGLATFASELQGRKVIVFSDNRGAEACLHCVSRWCLDGV